MPWYVSFHCILDAAWVWGCGGWGGWLLVGLSKKTDVLRCFKKQVIWFFKKF